MRRRTQLVSPLDRVLFLRTLPVLADLTTSQVAAVAGHATERFFRQGSWILHPDRPTDKLHIVIEGRVSTWRYRPEPEVVGPGEMVGFLHLFAGAVRGAEARAETDVLTLELDWNAQLAVCEEHFPVLLGYVRYLARRSVEAFRRFPEELSFALAPGASSADRELDIVERTLALRRSGSFARGDADALWELARHSQLVELPTGATVWSGGASADHVLVVASGTVRCSPGPGGPAFEMGPASMLGLEEALAGEPRWYGAEASTPVRALRLDLEPLADVLEDHFRLALHLTSDLARRLVELLRRHPVSPAAYVSRRDQGSGPRSRA